jgi:mannose-6-phosphate isomerase-like protein (cupin superfamily)
MTSSGPGALRQSSILRGGQPKNGPTRTFPDSDLVALITGQQTEGKLAIFEQTMAPNGAVPLHINHRENESFYLVDGKYLFEVGGMIHELGPASHVLVPRGVPHRFRCTESREAVPESEARFWF